MSRRGQILGEMLLRVVLIGLIFAFLPKVFPGDIPHFLRFATRTSLHPRPYSKGHRYLIGLPYKDYVYEFPPLTLVFLLPKLLFGTLSTYRWAFGLIMASFELGSLCLLRKAWPEHYRQLTIIWYASVVPMAFLGWFRYDFPAIFFASIALIAMEKNRKPGRAGWATFLGFATKLWPATILASLVVKRRWRDVLTALIACGVFTALWYAWSPKGFHDFLQFRGGVGLEVESLFASVKMLFHHAAACHPARKACSGVGLGSGAWVIDAGGWKWVGPVMYLVLGVYALAVTGLAWRRRNVDVVALAGALTLASFLISRIISAQYVLWTAPFIAIVFARGHKRVGWLNVGSSVFTFIYLLFFDPALVRHGNQAVAGVVLVRNLILIALLVELTRAIFQAPKDAPEGVSDDARTPADSNAATPAVA